MNIESLLPLLLLQKSDKSENTIYNTISLVILLWIFKILSETILDKLKKINFRTKKSQIISTPCIQTVIKNFVSITPGLDYMAMCWAMMSNTYCNKKKILNMHNIGTTFYSHSDKHENFRLIPDIGIYKTFDGQICFEMKEEDSSTTDNNNNNDKNTIKERKYNKSNIIMSSYILTQSQLEAYKNKIMEEYKKNEELYNMQNQKLYIFTLTADIKTRWQEDIDNGFQINELYEIPENSWISEEHKETFTDMLKQLTNIEYHTKRGITRGFKAYVYGKPGTGKTMFSKWIACQANNSHYFDSEETKANLKKQGITLRTTGRHIISLNLNFIGDYSVLLQLLSIKKIGNINFRSWDDIVFVVDEADFSDIKKEGSKEVVKNKQTVKVEEGTSDDKLKKLLEACVETNKITLSLYLQILDGLIQMPGIIIIFTSNISPEGLPPALFRNGRLQPYEFSESTCKDVKDMIKLHWEVDISDEQFLRIPNKKITNTTLLYLLNQKHGRTKNIDNLINDICEI